MNNNEFYDLYNENFFIKNNNQEVEKKQIDIKRIFNKLDELYAKNDIAEIEKLFKYWFNEAKVLNNKRLELELHNEMMGFCRMHNQKEEAFFHTKESIQLINELGIDKTISAGTIYLNVATVYKSFNEPNIAIDYYQLANNIYEEVLDKNDKKLACLYNNMALAYVDISNFDEAEILYKKAIEIMNNNQNGELDQAISYLNYTDMLYLKYKSSNFNDENIKNCIHNNIQTAFELLNKEQEYNKYYYKFVCEKCIPCFKYYGYLNYVNILQNKININNN